MYIYTKYFSASEKKEILPFLTTWMDLEDIMLFEINQAMEDKLFYNITDMWNLKQPNLQKQIVEQWLSGVGGWGTGKMLLKGINL